MRRSLPRIWERSTSIEFRLRKALTAFDTRADHLSRGERSAHEMRRVRGQTLSIVRTPSPQPAPHRGEGAHRVRGVVFALSLLLYTTVPALSQAPETEARSFRGYIESLWPLAQAKGVER